MTHTSGGFLKSVNCVLRDNLLIEAPAYNVILCSSWAWHRHTQSTVCLGATSETGPVTGTVGGSLVSLWHLCPGRASVSGVNEVLVSVVSLYIFMSL